MINDEKLSTPNDNTRKGYYESVSGISRLRDAVKELQDTDLQKEVKKLQDQLKVIHQKLESKYLWD